jgi:iron complex transport system ATP-binding protein
VTRIGAYDIGVSLRGRWVITNVSLRCQPGELTAIIGPNGAGKTTLLRALAGLQQIHTGRITLDDVDIRSIPRRMLARRLSFVPQNSLFPFAFSVREVVAAGRNPYLGRFQREGIEDREKIEQALHLTDTAKLIHRPITELSGGERQRVMIARSLATDAPVILMDEPTANLDPAHALDVLELCRTLAVAGRAVILTTQDLAMAMRYSERVVLMKSGRITNSGKREEVLTESAIESVFNVRAVRAYTAQGEPTMLFHRR